VLILARKIREVQGPLDEASSVMDSPMSRDSIFTIGDQETTPSHLTKQELSADRFNAIPEDADEDKGTFSRRPPPLKEEILFYVEPRYCTECNLDQPLRTKHCKVCERCVSTHDHHCPWVGNCVAQRNRPTFFAFILSLQV
jgi:hypothetical protein